MLPIGSHRMATGGVRWHCSKSLTPDRNAGLSPQSSVIRTLRVTGSCWSIAGGLEQAATPLEARASRAVKTRDARLRKVKGVNPFLVRADYLEASYLYPGMEFVGKTEAG